MNIGLDGRKIKDFGIGTYIQHVLSSLPGLLQNHSFHLICFPHHIQYTDSLSSNSIFYTPTKAKNYSLAEHIVLARLAKNLKLDLFHAPHYVVPAFIKCKTITTIHDIIHLLYPNKGILQKIIAKALINSSIAKVNKIITVSENSRNDIISLYPAASSKIQVIYNGVDQYFFQPPAENELSDAKKNFHLPAKYILYVGNYLKHKNIQRLLIAFQLFVSTQSDYSLVLVGGIPEQIITTAVDNAFISKIISIPYIDRAILKSIYYLSDFLVMPSLYEGFGLPVLEAMACKKAVACSKIPVFEELAGDIPLYFDPKNSQELTKSMTTLSKDDELKHTIEQKGFQRAQFFTWEKSCTAHAQLYDEVLQQ